MKIKNLLSAMMGGALLTLMSLSAFAQVGRLEGDVVKAGTGEPIAGAEVQIIRTDIKGNYPVKTDKKGHFLHAGVPFVGTYTVIISAEGHEPAFATGIRPDKEPLKFELRPGDGRKLTLEDTKKRCRPSHCCWRSSQNERSREEKGRRRIQKSRRGTRRSREIQRFSRRHQCQTKGRQ